MPEKQPDRKIFKLTIHQALFLSFGVLLGLMAVICLVSWFFYDELEEDQSLLSQQTLPRVIQLRKLALANNNLSSLAGKTVRARNLSDLTKLREFSRAAISDVEQQLERSQALLGTEGDIGQLLSIHYQVDRNLLQLVDLVQDRLELEAATIEQHDFFLALTQRIKENFVSSALRPEISTPQEWLLLDGLGLIGKLSDAISSIEHLDLQVDVDLQAADFDSQLTAFGKALSRLEPMLGTGEAEQTVDLLEEMVLGESSLLAKQRQRINNAALIESLLLSTEQLNAQFKLLTSAMVKRAGAQVDHARGEMVEDITQRKLFMVLMILISLGISAGVVWGLGYRQLARPLTRLSRNVTSFGAGQLKVVENLSGIWEVQNLNASFQEMAQGIAQRDEELRQLQWLLRNVIDSLTPSIIAVDQQCRLKLWNLQAQKLSPEGLVRGVHIKDLLGWLPVDFEEIEAAVKERRLWQAKLPQVYKDDESRAYELSCVPLLGEEQQGSVLKIEDVTERMRLEKVIAQSEKMLSVGGLASGIAHEINNPLAGIMQNAQVLENRLSPSLASNQRAAEECGVEMPALENYLEKRGIKTLLEGIRGSAERAAKIVKNMLAFGRSSAMLEDPQYEKADLVALVEDTITLLGSDYDLRREYDLQKVEIKRNYADGLPLISCEPSLIRQMLFNVLKNCIQTFDKDLTTACVSVSLWQDEDRLQMAIEDNGPGMPEVVRQRIFEPFFSTREVGRGSGLGMSVAYYIVSDFHQGRIDVESVPGQGSRFNISLPIEQSGKTQSPVERSA